MTGIPIVTALRPKIRRALAGETDASDTFDLLDAVFGRRHQPERSAVLHGERLAVHLIYEKRLRVQNARHIHPDVIAAVGRHQRNIWKKILRAIDVRLASVMRCGQKSGDKVGKSRARPINYRAPTFDTFQLSRHLDAREIFDVA